MDDVIYNISIQNFVDDYSEFISLPENMNKPSLFYDYISVKYDDFIEKIKSINESRLQIALKGFGDFNGNPSKIRFVNFLRKICQELKNILKEAYSPNQSKALILLEKFLGNNNSKLMRYIVEPYINYCSASIDSGERIFYRTRVVNKGEEIDNCWHTPFHIRQNSYTGRFSSAGFPCLYVSEDKETSLREIDKEDGSKKYYVGTFKLKNKQTLICLDLTFPKNEEIEKMNGKEKIKLLISYPLRILCSVGALHKSGGFAEEYLFSQMLMNVIACPIDENRGMPGVHGVKYGSKKYEGGINYALPAVSQSVPPAKNELFSEKLQNLLEQTYIEEIKNE